jgi:hypothetical protein
MSIVTTTQAGISSVISQLQKQKDQLTLSYREAISNGEKFVEIKMLYLNLKEVDNKLNDLLRVATIAI